MERTIPPKIKLPDAINCASYGDFTIIPNSIIRSPLLTGKAKTVLSILLSNKEGWHSYLNSLQKMMKEGKDAISSAVQELEEYGYVMRIRYRSKKTKQWAGSFWAYTDEPWQFEYQSHVEELQKYGLEIHMQEDPHTGNPDVENPDVENPQLIILNKNNTKLKNNTKKFFSIIPKQDPFHPILQEWLEYKAARKQSYASERSVQAFLTKLKKLSNNNPATAQAIIEESMANNWAGVFALQPNNKTSGPQKKRAYDEDPEYRKEMNRMYNQFEIID